MEKKSSDLFAFDLDGTLVHTLDGGTRGIPTMLREALHELSRVATIVVATGRRYKAARIDIETLPPTPYRIVHNGLVIKDHNEQTVQTAMLPADRAVDVAKRIEAEGFSAFLVSDGWDHGIDFTYRSASFAQHPHIELLKKRPHQNFKLIEDFEEALAVGFHPILEVASLGDYDSLARLREQLMPVLAPEVQMVLVRNVGYAPISALEIFDKRFSKWQAVNFVKRQMGLERVFGVGDDGNDLELIRDADVGVAMSHADQAILDVSDRRVDGPQGLTDFIWNYLKNEAR